MAKKIISGECIYCHKMVYPMGSDTDHYAKHGKGKNAIVNFFHEECWRKVYARDLQEDKS